MSRLSCRTDTRRYLELLSPHYNRRRCNGGNTQAGEYHEARLSDFSSRVAHPDVVPGRPTCCRPVHCVTSRLCVEPVLDTVFERRSSKDVWCAA
uniref:Uncharacterized protein n=1 Tax=Hyaloperonospora arabidopsidis (strain Emoy2) TaxID=559515 RepID=M4BVH4_HYAAE